MTVSRGTAADVCGMFLNILLMSPYELTAELFRGISILTDLPFMLLIGIDMSQVVLTHLYHERQEDAEQISQYHVSWHSSDTVALFTTEIEGVLLTPTGG